MSFSSNAEFDANQVNLASRSTAQKNLARLQAYDAIISCLYTGGYSVSTIVAAATYYNYLKILEIRLTALSLIEGGGASETMGSETTYKEWVEKAQKQLDNLCAGKTALTNSNTSAVIEPPSFSTPGIVTDGRQRGVDITDPLDWREAEPLNEDLAFEEED